MSKNVDYSKWDHIEVSDDEDDTHPNVDKSSMMRWHHQARMERMEQQKQEKAKLEQESKEHMKKVKEVTEKIKKMEVNQSSESEAEKLKLELAALKKQEEVFKKKEADLAKRERLTPWNVDTLSKDGFEKTIINKPKKKEDVSEEDRHKQMLSFIDKYEKEIKYFGVIQNFGKSSEYLRDHPYLVRIDTANYLTMWCVNMEVKSQSSLMKTVAQQAVILQYILGMAKELDRDPRSCAPGFFRKIKYGGQYLEVFENDVQGFIEKVQAQAKARIEEVAKQYEEEERQKRLGPGGMDPLEVLETLPPALKECFETGNIANMQTALDSMSVEETTYHIKRCIDSGLLQEDKAAKAIDEVNDEPDQRLDDQEDFMNSKEKDEKEDLDLD